MEIVPGLDEVPQRPGGRSLALGTFDGVHRGHRRVIESALDWARTHGATASVVTFDPHPLQVLRPDDPPRLLTTTDVKLDLIAGLGVDEIVVIPFTTEFAGLEPEEFCARVLCQALDARRVSVGENFRFGRGASGDSALLRGRPEFETYVVPLIEHRGGTVSSSRIRKLVEEGKVAEAMDLLGAPFTFAGTVVEGAARGRTLDMPTANLEPPAGVVLPSPGIYAARAVVDGKELPAAVSIGVRPTFEVDGELKVEAHLVGLERDLYGRRIQLEFLERLRDELRFESAEDLVEQMKKDVEETVRIVEAAG